MLDWLSLTEDGVEDDIGRADCSLERLNPVHHWNTKVLCLLEETDVDILVPRLGVVDRRGVLEVVQVTGGDKAITSLPVSWLKGSGRLGSTHLVAWPTAYQDLPVSRNWVALGYRLGTRESRELHQLVV